MKNWNPHSTNITKRTMLKPRLKRIAVQNFKCFQYMEISLGLLTVLCGLNSGGKSTMLQPILLYSQALRAFRGGDEEMSWPLNGELTNLGRFGNVLYNNPNQTHNADVIQILFELTDSQAIDFNLIKDHDDRFLKPLEKSGSECTEVNNLILNAQFLSPIRLGSYQTQEKPKIPSYFPVGVGIDGSYACYWLNTLKFETVPPEMCRENSGISDLGTQLNAWLDYVFPGTQAHAISEGESNILSLTFKTSELQERNIPSNIGFGITYLFPVLVSLLLARPGDCIIIDSPEAHLNPGAQSRMGKLLAKFASTGIQLLVETHSEHILNGLRIAVKHEVMEPSDVSIYFFPDTNSENQKVENTKIDKNGLINNWPEDFFDQSEKDIVEILEAN